MRKTDKQQTNKMASQPINRLMLTMGAPIILSMMLQAFYNIVDSAFVSNMAKNGELALNALTLAFPVQMLMVAVSIGTGVGANALLSKHLGSGSSEQCSKTAGNSIFLGILIYIACLLFGIFGVDAYVKTQTANSIIYSMTTSYLRICCTVSMGIVFFGIFEKMLQATGRTTLSTIAQITGAVTNIILDPILIYGLFGIPAMGVQGAAAATVAGQMVSALMGLVFHCKYNKEISKNIKYIKPSGKIIGEIYAIGIPAIIAQALMSFMTYGLNVILVKINESAVTAYGLYYKLQQFILFAAFGLRDAITPIVSFNYGMGSKTRIVSGIKYGMLYTIAVMTIGMLALEIFANPLVDVFGLSGDTAKFCISALRIISLSFVFAGANIAFQGVFQALNGGLQSLIISLLRQLILVLPVAWVFSIAAAKNPSQIWLVWLTFIIAEGLSCIAAAIFMLNIHKNIIKPIK